MKTKLLGLIVARSVSLGFTVGVSITIGVIVAGPTRAATLVGVDGLVVDGTTYNVTFVNSTYSTVYASTPPTFLGETSTAEHAAIALANALNILGATNYVYGSNLFIPYQYVSSPPASSYDYNVYNSAAKSGNTGGWLYATGTNYPVDSYGGTYTDYTVFVAETPVLPALPLFATGLGALGLLGWRRKRKAAAIAA
jgi:hypothetical protein